MVREVVVVVVVLVVLVPPLPWHHGEPDLGGKHHSPMARRHQRAREERGQERWPSLQVSLSTRAMFVNVWPCRGKRHLCPKVSTKLLSRQELWQLRQVCDEVFGNYFDLIREGGVGERTFTVIHRQGDGNSWIEAVVRQSDNLIFRQSGNLDEARSQVREGSEKPGRLRRRSRKRDRSRQTRQRRSQARFILFRG